MLAKLEFDLRDRDERMSHMRAVKSLDLVLALWQFREDLHQLEEMEEDMAKIAAIEEVQQLFGRVLEDKNINFEELVE